MIPLCLAVVLIAGIAVYAIASTSRTSARLISAQRQSTIDVSGAIGAAVTQAVQGAVTSLIAPPPTHDPRSVDPNAVLPNMPTYEFPDKFDPEELIDPTDAYIPDYRQQVGVGLDTGIAGFTFEGAPNA